MWGFFLAYANFFAKFYSLINHNTAFKFLQKTLLRLEISDKKLSNEAVSS